MAKKTDIREDIFVSVIVPEGDCEESTITILQSVAARLSERFRYWEIIFGIDPEKTENDIARFKTVRNLRLMVLRSGVSLYRKRVAVVEESIGDVVVVSSLVELPKLDLNSLIETAITDDTIVMTRHKKRKVPFDQILAVIGRSAGFRVSLQATSTTCYPRGLLNRILASNDRELGLRFPPIDRTISVCWIDGFDLDPPRRDALEFGRRLMVLRKLFVSSAPRTLAAVSSLSLGFFFVSVLYVLYAVTVWLLMPTQPGWLTLSLILGILMCFISLAVAALSIGIERIIELVSRERVDDLIFEQSAVDMFGQVMTELNVELDDSTISTPLTKKVGKL